MEFLRAILALFLAFFSVFNVFDGPSHVQRPQSTKSFEYLEYPAEAVKSPGEAGLKLSEFLSRADDDGDELYVNAQGYQDICGIIKSPYFKAFVEGKSIPVYGTTVFVGETQKGALHSFCEIYIDTTQYEFVEFQLNAKDFFINELNVFPSTAKMETIFEGSTVNMRITDIGTYTFVFNGNDQEHGFTLFVKELVDEEAEIIELERQYGIENVIVVEKGLHKSPCYNFYGSNNKVYYLKRGAYLLAEHKYDINSEADDMQDTSKQDTAEMNAGQLPLGLTRIPFLNFNVCNNVKLLGNGVIDLSQLDRRERRGIVFAYSNNIEVDGIKIINPPEWSFITYDCENVTIKNVDVFGYRQNSDAFAICNTRNATIENSFCRSGDDLFDVKTAGGRAEAISKNITFSNCTAWNGKARCFGICGEVEKDIQDVTFRDSTVIFHDATWDLNRIPAIAIVVENQGGSISNVTFENMEIYKAHGRAIGCLIYNSAIENFNISDIVYKNITYNSAQPNKIASNGKTTNKISATFENVYGNGSKLTSLDSKNFEYDQYATITVK